MVRLVGVIDPQVCPDAGESVSNIVPVKPLRADTVMVTFVFVPTVTLDGEVAAMVKSVTWKVAVAE